MAFNDVVMRRLSEADVADYRAIRLAALHEAPDAFGSTYAAEAQRPAGAFAERLATSVVVAAYAARDVVGMAGFKAEAGRKHRHKGYIWGLYVSPRARRRGIAELLMGEVLSIASQYVEQVTLTLVRGNDAALALYEKLGFSAYGVEPRSLIDSNGYSDEILMIKFLRPEGMKAANARQP